MTFNKFFLIFLILTYSLNFNNSNFIILDEETNFSVDARHIPSLNNYLSNYSDSINHILNTTKLKYLTEIDGNHYYILSFGGTMKLKNNMLLKSSSQNKNNLSDKRGSKILNIVEYFFNNKTSINNTSLNRGLICDHAENQVEYLFLDDFSLFHSFKISKNNDEIKIVLSRPNHNIMDFKILTINSYLNISDCIEGKMRIDEFSSYVDGLS